MLCRLFLAVVALASFEVTAAATQPLQTSVVATRTLQEQGMTMEGVGVQPVEVKGTEAWVSRHKSVPADEWARSFLFTITDERFKKGKVPVVDVEVVYMHEGNTKVELVADTARGSQVVGSGWGNKKEWQTLHCTIDDAYFGGRATGNDPKKLPVDGFDLRLNAWAGDLHIKRITVTGRNPANPAPDEWARYLSIKDVTDDRGFIVAPGESNQITFKVKNEALLAANAVARLEIVDAGGRVIGTTVQDVTLAARATETDQPVITPITFTFDAADRQTGAYGARLSVDVGSGESRRTAIAYEQAVAVAGPLDLFIIFDQQPIARGLEFDRADAKPVQLTVGGSKQWAWTSTGSRGGDGWWHSMVMKVTDERFRDGKMPAVDVRVTYRNEANAPVTLTADAGAGSRQIASGWGNNPKWQQMHAQIDDATFSAGSHGSDPKAMMSDGWDLRYNSCNGPVQLRSIFIRGFDRDADPDYARLLRFDGLDAGRDLFVFEPGEALDFTLKMRNLARVDLPAEYTVRLTDDLGREMWSRDAQARIAGDGPFDLRVPFDSTGLPQGVYTLVLDVGRRTATGERQALISPSIDLMVAERSQIAKAKPGEFMYGVDSGVGYADERWMQWLDFMGCDITRGNGANRINDDWAPAFAAFDRYNIRNTVFADVPWDEDPSRRAQEVRDVAAKSEARAKTFGDRITYWELGNEPDLTFFYPGPIDEYVKGFVEISAAIRRGNPNAIVMNGGLCHAGEEADRRARRFIELVPSESIQCWAFHAHGPGARSERVAYERMYTLAKQHGKADRPIMDTESGVSARTPGQKRIQARTAVEKMVYAQSVGMPTLMWFRLNILGGDGDYTNTKNVREPRPVVLSYRTMARTLKGLTFSRKLEVSASSDNGGEAYLFAQKDGDGRAICMWATGRGGGTVTLRLSDGPQGVTDVRIVDLFGNVTPLPHAGRGGVVTVPLELDPGYVTWRDASAPATVAVLPSPLMVNPVVTVSPGASDVLTVQVRNQSDQPLAATLLVTTGQATGVALQQPDVELMVPANTTQAVTVPVTVAAERQTLAWPQGWTVFAPVPTGAVDVTQFSTRVPERIEVQGQTVQPQSARSIDGQVDLSSLGGGVAEQREAVLFAELESPAAQTIRVGSSADWWQQWFVNGRPVFDTLATGNAGPQSILEHTFDMPLQAGRNVIAVRVLSGSQGWKLLSGGPDELAAAKGAASGDGNAISFELRQGTNVLARERAVVAIRPVVRPLDAEQTWDGPVASWDSVVPDGDLTEEHVINEWAKQPDSSKWWQGDSDLSGRVWVRQDAAHLYVTAAIRDDVFRAASALDAIETGDALRVAIVSAGGTPLQLGLPADGTRVFRRDGASGAWSPMPPEQATAKVERVDGAATTWYRLRIARPSVVESGSVAINVLANDDDFGRHKQSVAWQPGIDQEPAPTWRWWQGLIK